MLTGAITHADEFAEDDLRRNHPASATAPSTPTCARRRGARRSPAQAWPPGQVALAWSLAQGDDVVPIPGTKQVSRVRSNTRAIDVRLSDGQRTRLDALADQVRGHRSPRPELSPSDSGERRDHDGSASTPST